MREVARLRLSLQDFGQFERSIQPLLDSVDREIKTHEQNLTAVNVGPSLCTTLGEFVITGRVLGPRDVDFSWNAANGAVGVCGCWNNVKAYEPNLFDEAPSIPASGLIYMSIADSWAFFQTHDTDLLGWPCIVAAPAHVPAHPRLLAPAPLPAPALDYSCAIID
jgi:hypothetical protein